MRRSSLLCVCGVLFACSNEASTLLRPEAEPPGVNCRWGGSRISSGKDLDGDGKLQDSEVGLVFFSCPGGGSGEPLLRLDPEGPGVNCAAGGTKILIGSDEDGNQLLQESEVTSSSYVCNGAFADGAALLARAEPESPGSNCPSGGTKLTSGTDGNRDGVLQDEEVTGTSFLCTGAGTSGAISIVRQDWEPAGSNCALGGTKVASGVDANADGVLQDGEVTSVSYSCLNADGITCTTLEGSIEIRNSLDWQQLVRSGCQVITGDLVINAPGVTRLPGEAAVGVVFGKLVVRNSSLESLAGLTGLQHVGGLHLEDNLFLSTLDLPSLHSIGEAGEGYSLYLAGSPNLTSWNLPKLATVGGSIYLRGMARVELPALVEVKGGLGLEQNTGLTAFGLPMLETLGKNRAGYSLDLVDNPDLTSLSLPLLTTLGGAVRLSNSPALTSLSLPSATAIGQDPEGSSLHVGGSNLTRLALPALVSLEGSLHLSWSFLLESVELPALSTLGKDADGYSLYLGDLPALAALSLPALTQAAGAIYLENNVALASASLPALVSVGGTLDVHSGHPALKSVGLPALETVGGSLRVDCELTSLDLNALASVERYVYVSSSVLTSLALPALTRVGTGPGALVLMGNSALSSLELPALATVGGLRISSAAALTSIRLPALTQIGAESAYITANSALTTLSMPALTRVSGGFQVQGHALTSLSLPALTAVDGGLDLSGNSALTSVSIPALTALGRSSEGHGLNLSMNPALTSAYLPSLATVGGNLRLAGNGKLTSMVLSSLTSVDGDFFAAGNVVLPRLNVPELARIGGTLQLNTDDALESLELPALVSIGDSLQITRTGLTGLGLPALSTVGGDLRIHDNPSLPQCQALALRSQLGTGLGGATLIVRNDSSATCL